MQFMLFCKQHSYKQHQAETGKKNLANAFIHILHWRYHPQMVGFILKIRKEQVCLYSWDCMINHSESDDEKEK